MKKALAAYAAEWPKSPAGMLPPLVEHDSLPESGSRLRRDVAFRCFPFYSPNIGRKHEPTVVWSLAQDFLSFFKELEDDLYEEEKSLGIAKGVVVFGHISVGDSGYVGMLGVARPLRRESETFLLGSDGSWTTKRGRISQKHLSLAANVRLREYVGMRTLAADELHYFPPEQ